jgi:hypothetical protein
MAGNFLPSATFFDISEKSPGQPRKAIALDAGQNLRVRRHEMDTWHTTNANPGDHLSRAIERARKRNFAQDNYVFHQGSKSFRMVYQLCQTHSGRIEGSTPASSCQSQL